MARLALCAAALYLRQLHPCAALRARPRGQCGRAIGRVSRRGDAASLQPELQSRPHARPLGAAPRRPGRFSVCRGDQFGIAVHARRCGNCRGRIRSPARQCGDRLPAVRAAARTGLAHRLCGRIPCRQPRSRRRHAADRHRLARRRRRARLDPAPSARRRILQASLRSGPRPDRGTQPCIPSRSTSGSMAAPKCSSRACSTCFAPESSSARSTAWCCTPGSSSARAHSTGRCARCRARSRRNSA